MASLFITFFPFGGTACSSLFCPMWWICQEPARSQQLSALGGSSIFSWPLHGHARPIHGENDDKYTSIDAAFQAKRNMVPGWWLNPVFGSGHMTVTQNWVWVENGCGRMPGSHSSCPCCEAHVSYGWVEDMHVCVYECDEHSWPSVVLYIVQLGASQIQLRKRW